jgi:hypothetical protein
VLNSKLLTTLDAFKLRDDKYTFFSHPTQTETLFSNSKAFKTLMKFFSVWCFKIKIFKNDYVRLFALIEKADFLAKRFKFLFNLNE